MNKISKRIKSSNDLSTPLMKVIFPISKNLSTLIENESHISNKLKSFYSNTKFSAF